MKKTPDFLLSPKVVVPEPKRAAEEEQEEEYASLRLKPVATQF